LIDAGANQAGHISRGSHRQSSEQFRQTTNWICPQFHKPLPRGLNLNDAANDDSPYRHHRIIAISPAFAEEAVRNFRKQMRCTKKTQMKEAEAAFRDVIRKEPDNPKAHQRLEAVLGAMGEEETEFWKQKSDQNRSQIFPFAHHLGQL